MSDADFADLRSKVVPRSVRRKRFSPDSAEAVEWIFSGYCERLLFKNERLRQLSEECGGQVESSQCWSLLTRGQRSLYCLAMLDLEVFNGGLTQFFWNHPAIVVETGEALRAIGSGDVAAAYDKAVDKLIANKDRWVELHSEFDREPGEVQPFQASYAVLDLAWFDEVYADEYGAPLRASAVRYVDVHKEEFITG